MKMFHFSIQACIHCGHPFHSFKKEDCRQKVRVPAPGHAEIRATKEDCGEDESAQIVLLTEQQISCTCPVIVSLLVSLCL